MFDKWVRGDGGEPVAEGYAPPFACSGKIARVVVDVSDEAVRRREMETRIAFAR